MFQVVAVRPHYCPLTDACTGSTSRPLPMTYHTLAWARAKAALLERDEYEGGGDVSYYAARTIELRQRATTAEEDAARAAWADALLAADPLPF